MHPIEVRNAVIASVEELSGVARPIRDRDALAEDLGIDSFSALNLFKAIEDRLGTMLPEGCEGDLVGVRTVGELVDRLIAVLAADASDSAAAP